MRQFQYSRLNVHVSASDRALIRAAHTSLSDHGKTLAMREARHQWLREILAIHHEHQELVREFRF